LDGSTGVISAPPPLSACSGDATGLENGNGASVACIGNGGVCGFSGEAADGWDAAWIAVWEAGGWFGGTAG